MSMFRIIVTIIFIVFFQDFLDASFKNFDHKRIKITLASVTEDKQKRVSLSEEFAAEEADRKPLVAEPKESKLTQINDVKKDYKSCDCK